MKGVVDMANAGFEEEHEEPVPTPHQDRMRQAAFPSGQARYSTEFGGEIQVVSLSMALMLAKQLEDTEKQSDARAAALVKVADHARALEAAPSATLTTDAKDAARYRWLRISTNLIDRAMNIHSKKNGHMIAGEKLDAAIDKAMAATDGGAKP